MTASRYLRGTMRLAFAAAFLAPQARAQGAPAAYTAKALSPAEVRADVALMRRALEEIHAGYDRYTPRREMDSAFARLDRRANAPMTDVELYREVALLLAKIRCNHTKAEYPQALSDFREKTPTHLPVRVRVFGDRLFADVSAGNSIVRGTEILSINGTSAKDVITRLSKYVVVDGYTNFSRAVTLEADADLMGSDLDHYWPIEFGFPAEWTLRLRSPRGASREVRQQPITFAAWKALSGDTTDVDFRNGTTWSMLDDTTAVLRVRSFINYRRYTNPDSVYRPIFAALRARGVKHLIVDIRRNGGGSDDASQGLMRYLISSPLQAVRSSRRRTITIDSALAAQFDTWGNRAPIFTPKPEGFIRRADGWFEGKMRDVTLQPAADAFRGRVSMLVGRRNGSGSTMLLAVLQEAGARAGTLRLVGEESGGSAEGPSAGQILFLRLPASGMRVRIPLYRTDVNVTSFVPGFGVFPDVDGTETLADFRATIDRALVTARTTPWSRNTSVLAPTSGLMRGVLEYRDYGSGERVTLPTWSHLSPIGSTGAFRQRTIYDDGPGKTIYSTDVLRVAGDQWIEGAGGDDGAASTDQSTLRITSRRQTPAGVALVLRGSGSDDNKRVDFRYTVTLGDSVSTRLKEFRATAGEPWEYRHEYRLTRGTP
jgi:Peptidase family S41